MGKFELDKNTLKLVGIWDYKAPKSQLKELKKLKIEKLDLENLEHIDYAMAIFISKNFGDFNLINSNDKFDIYTGHTKNYTVFDGYDFDTDIDDYILKWN